MDMTGKTLWQVGSGDTQRSYGDICKQYDVMMIGPGEPGPFEEASDKYEGYDVSNLVRFYQNAKRGDIVLLRDGTSRVLAVGEIVDDKPEWNELFSDVDGWDLQHIRRVRWFNVPEEKFPNRTFGGQVKTFAAVNVTSVWEWVNSLEIPADQHVRKLADIPLPGKKLELDEIGSELFNNGLPSTNVRKILENLENSQRIANWYWNEKMRPEGRPSETETITYLVVPLLFSIGWSEQTTALEWRNIDVALFGQMPSSADTLSCVIEAKTLGSSVFAPFEQGKFYLEKIGKTRCNRLIITNGIRYSFYQREEEEIKLKSYMNILDPRDGYPLFDSRVDKSGLVKCKGLVETLLGMSNFASTGAP